MLYQLFLDIADLVHEFGYFGIFIMTFVESTFIPIPAEVTLIPAGYLVHKGLMNGILVWIVSILGTMTGSLFNYSIAYYFGRQLFIKYGKYFFMGEDKLKKIEKFFKSHGAISTFTGRLLPGLKHFISFPAGLAKMDIKVFSIFTAAGGSIWCGILIALGFVIGENEHLITKYLKQINYIIFVCVACFCAFYIWKKKINNQDIAED